MRTEDEPRITIGTQFTKRNPKDRNAIWTVVDIHETFNSKGERVRVSYVAEKQFMGVTVTDYHVCDTTVVMGEIRQ